MVTMLGSGSVVVKNGSNSLSEDNRERGKSDKSGDVSLRQLYSEEMNFLFVCLFWEVTEQSETHYSSGIS